MTDLKILDTPVKLNLVGLDGNAFCLLGNFQTAARRQRVPIELIAKVINEAKSGDYNHLLQVLIANTEEVDED